MLLCSWLFRILIGDRVLVNFNLISCLAGSLNVLINLINTSMLESRVEHSGSENKEEDGYGEYGSCAGNLYNKFLMERKIVGLNLAYLNCAITFS